MHELMFYRTMAVQAAILEVKLDPARSPHLARFLELEVPFRDMLEGSDQPGGLVIDFLERTLLLGLLEQAVSDLSPDPWRTAEDFSSLVPWARCEVVWSNAHRDIEEPPRFGPCRMKEPDQLLGCARCRSISYCSPGESSLSLSHARVPAAILTLARRINALRSLLPAQSTRNSIGKNTSPSASPQSGSLESSDNVSVRGLARCLSLVRPQIRLPLSDLDFVRVDVGRRSL